MAHIVNLQDRLKAKQDEDARYLERMDLTSRMIPVMVETVEKFASMGASPGHIVRFLQATIDEINSSPGAKAEMTGLKAKRDLICRFEFSALLRAAYRPRRRPAAGLHQQLAAVILNSLRTAQNALAAR